MASNFRQKSDSSGSNTLRPTGRNSRRADRASSRYRHSRALSQDLSPRPATRRVESKTVAQIDREHRRAQRSDAASRAASASRVPFVVIGIIVAVIIVAVVTVFLLSRTDAFEIEDVNIDGVEHLTSQELGALISIPQGTTLLNVDADSIARTLKRDSWVQDVQITREFPSTLVISITERQIAAIAEVPVGATQTIQNWAISKDDIWLMAIPSRESEIGSQISEQIYEDADQALHITKIPPGLNPEIGKECTDDDIVNALDIISGLTTELADRVKTIEAPDKESTSLILEDNIEIAFGSAENIREKELVCLEIMENNPTVVYINVRVVDRPTWRAA